jgi:hypothetical protein
MMTYISEEPACLAQILRDYRQKLAAIETFRPPAPGTPYFAAGDRIVAERRAVRALFL